MIHIFSVYLNLPSQLLLTLNFYSLSTLPSTLSMQVADMRRAMEDLRHQGRQRVAALITEGTKHTLHTSSPHTLHTSSPHIHSKHPLHTLSTHLLHVACDMWHVT